ncbi:hypothetical protein L2D01_04160 [Hyphomonadaceae bacterium ML37]|nr:hypothetical protein L2D01_04160 [Hyphomonadaceae bacterium ML37]
MISFGPDGNVAAAGSARLERDVSANPGMRGTITLPGEGAQQVTGAWEQGSAVLFFGAERALFSGREYAGRPGTNTRILAGRMDGRPVFFSCDPAAGPAPAPVPEPDRDAGPAPRPADGDAWRPLTVPFQSAIDLDAGRVDRLDGSSDFPDAEFILVNLGNPAFVVPEIVRTGSPEDGSGSLADRCRRASESGGWTRQMALPLDAVTPGSVICVQTTRRVLGAIRLDRVGEADAGLSYQMFRRGGPG